MAIRRVGDPVRATDAVTAGERREPDHRGDERRGQAGSRDEQSSHAFSPRRQQVPPPFDVIEVFDGFSDDPIGEAAGALGEPVLEDAIDVELAGHAVPPWAIGRASASMAARMSCRA